MKEGTRVKLNPDSRYFRGKDTSKDQGGHNGVGTWDGNCYVQWDNGQQNWYQLEDLIEITSKYIWI